MKLKELLQEGIPNHWTADNFIDTAYGSYVKNKEDRAAMALFQKLIDHVGFDRITDYKRSSSRSGKTLGIQVDKKHNIFYRSAWKGISGDKYAAMVTVGDKSFPMKAAGVKEFANWIKKL